MSKYTSWIFQYIYKWNTRFLLISLLAGIAPFCRISSANMDQNAVQQEVEQELQKVQQDLDKLNADIKEGSPQLCKEYLTKLMQKGDQNIQERNERIKQFFKNNNIARQNLVQLLSQKLKELNIKEKDKKNSPNKGERKKYLSVIEDLLENKVLTDNDLSSIDFKNIKKLYESNPKLRTSPAMKKRLETAVLVNNLDGILLEEKKYKPLCYLLKDKIATFPIDYPDKNKGEIQGWSDLLAQLILENNFSIANFILNKKYLMPYDIKWEKILNKKKDFGSSDDEKKLIDSLLSKIKPGAQETKEDKAFRLALVAVKKENWSFAEYLLQKKLTQKKLFSDLNEHSALCKWEEAKNDGPQKNFWQTYITVQFNLAYTKDADWEKKISRKKRSDSLKVIAPPALLITFIVVSLIYAFKVHIIPRIAISIGKYKTSKEERNRSHSEIEEAPKKQPSRARRNNQPSPSHKPSNGKRRRRKRKPVHKKDA